MKLRRLITQALLLLLISAVPALIAGIYNPKHPPLREETLQGDEITLARAMQLGDQVLWVDAREKAAFDKRHIPGAILLNEDNWDPLLERLLDAWSKDRTIVVYCSSLQCHSSREVAKRLREEVELKPVYVLKGGWETWVAAYP